MKKSLWSMMLLALFCSFVLSACYDFSKFLPQNEEHVHVFGEWATVKDPTCTINGEQERKCAECGEIEISPINALGHDWNEATCSVPKTCKKCSATEGALAEHTGEEIWIKHLDTHCLVYSCCYTPVSATEDHNMVYGICTICGFNPSITITSAEVTPEDTQVTLTISIMDNPGIAGLMLSLQYNTNVFDLIEATNEDALDILTFTAPNDLESGCVFIWDSIEVNDKDVKNGVFLRLTFDIAPNSLEGEYSILLKVNAYDNELTPFTLLIQGGLITIKNN